MFLRHFAATLLAYFYLSVGLAIADQPTEPKAPTGLAAEVWSLRGEHQPQTDERFAAVRAELAQRVETLGRVLDGTNTPDRWRAFLKWDKLIAHLDKDVKINRESLAELDQVLRRFRGNTPGLELKSFRNVAIALRKYRELAFWNALANRRDTQPLYESLVKQLQNQVTRHLEDPTVETARRMSKALTTIDYLGDAKPLVSQLKSRYAGNNIRAEVSVNAMNRLVKPICELEPVRDCILGASIRGQAVASGNVTFTAYESPFQAKLQLHLTGHLTSNTVGYKKPVKVYTTGLTNYSGSKSLYLSNDSFHATSAQVSATTKSRPHTIKKTGGKFGRRLIEKIAWKKVCKQKPCAERIASAKAERKLEAKFDKRVANGIDKGREQYRQRLQLPLQRWGLGNDLLKFASSSSSLLARAQLATGSQLTTDTLAPPRALANDLTVQVHQSAINNFLPLALSGVELRQEAEDEPLQLKGDMPPWLKKLSGKNKLQELSSSGESSEAEEDFKPFRLEFNSEHPASVSFQDGRMTIRLRFATLKTGDDEEEPPMQNWDFVIHYKLVQQDNQIVLIRDADIEVFPTNFDPRWDTKLSSKQVGIRNNIAKNLNKKARSGKGFPAKIEIPALRLPTQGGGNSGSRFAPARVRIGLVDHRLPGTLSCRELRYCCDTLGQVNYGLCRRDFFFLLAFAQHWSARRAYGRLGHLSDSLRAPACCDRRTWAGPDILPLRRPLYFSTCQ